MHISVLSINKILYLVIERSTINSSHNQQANPTKKHKKIDFNREKLQNY